MDKKIVGYVTYVVGGVALLTLVAAKPITSIVLVVAGLVNVFYVRK